MCWVMPPASPAATSVSRIASSSEVLPWSTWPMIVTTGGRSTSSSSASSNSGSSSTSSAAWTISTFFSNESASTSIASSGSVWVSVAISPSSISFLITSADERPSDSAISPTVAPELTGVGGSSTRRRRGRVQVGLDPRRAAAAAAAARRLLRAAAGPAGGVRPGSRSRRGGGGRRRRLRLRRPSGPGAGRARPACSRAARLLGAAWPPRRPWPASAASRTALPWRRRGGAAFAAAVLRGERALDLGLVHARGGRLHVQAGGLEHGEDLLRGDPLLLGYLVDALLGHRPISLGSRP